MHKTVDPWVPLATGTPLVPGTNITQTDVSTSSHKRMFYLYRMTERVYHKTIVVSVCLFIDDG